MQELLILFMIISILESVFIFDFKGRYERLLSSYKTIGLVLVDNDLMPKEKYENYIKNRR